MDMIEARGLGKTYGNGVVGLLDLDLTISEREIFGFPGANGAGKSTTVRILNGTLHPSQGRARVMGQDPDDPQIRGRTSSMGETAAMYESLSVRENLLFPDEPTSGLDPESAREVTGLIREVAREQGTTVFRCTHNLPLAERVCDRYGFIRRGRLVRSGTKAELVRASNRKPALKVRTARAELRIELEAENQSLNPVLARLMAEGHELLEAVRETISLEDLYFKLAGVHAGAGSDA